MSHSKSITTHLDFLQTIDLIFFSFYFPLEELEHNGEFHNLTYDQLTYQDGC